MTTDFSTSLDRVRRRYASHTHTVGKQRWCIRDTAPAGNTTPLLLLPGALGTGDVFFRILDRLGDRYRLISASLPDASSAPDMAQGLVGLLDALKVDQADILGSSLGGYIAQVAAHAAPERVRRLILANTFADPTLQQQRWPSIEVYAQRTPDEVLAHARQQWSSAPTDTNEQRELRTLLLSMLGAEQSADNIRALRMSVLSAVPLGHVPLPDSAVTVIDDDDDPVIAAQTRDHLRALYAACRHLRIPGGGHYPANLAPTAYQDAIVAVLDSPPPQAGVHS